MYKQKKGDMVTLKHKQKAISCSTPERRPESPSMDSDSLCGSEAGSPVPFLCTQDGAEGETDVVWNFYTPKSENIAQSKLKNTTPLSRRSKRSLRPKLIEKQLPKRKSLKTHKNTELFQELFELNQNLHEFLPKKVTNNCITETQQSGSEDDVFNDSSPQYSPKSVPRSSSRCLRKNVLSSNFTKPETETALESDDSMNECLLKASQIVEDNILNYEPTSKKACYENIPNIKPLKTDLKCISEYDSMDTILGTIKLESPVVSKAKKCESPCLKNDSFDSLFGNLNDSAFEQLTQMSVKMNTPANKHKLIKEDERDWTIKELILHDGSPLSKSIFSRHNSMPVSPSVGDCNKPSTSGMVFGRYNSMPFEKQSEKITVPGDSPIRCTPDEIKKKHQQAREKLLAKRLLPFTLTQQNSTQQSTQPTQTLTNKNTQFKPRVARSASSVLNNINNIASESKPPGTSNSMDIKMLIEKKRKEALMKLRRRQPQIKMT